MKFISNETQMIFYLAYTSDIMCVFTTELGNFYYSKGEVGYFVNSGIWSVYNA